MPDYPDVEGIAKYFDRVAALESVAEAASRAVGPSVCDRGPDGACQVECDDGENCARIALYEALARLDEMGADA